MFFSVHDPKKVHKLLDFGALHLNQHTYVAIHKTSILAFHKGVATHRWGYACCLLCEKNSECGKARQDVCAVLVKPDLDKPQLQQFLMVLSLNQDTY